MAIVEQMDKVTGDSTASRQPVQDGAEVVLVGRHDAEVGSRLAGQQFCELPKADEREIGILKNESHGLGCVAVEMNVMLGEKGEVRGMKGRTFKIGGGMARMLLVHRISPFGISRLLSCERLLRETTAKCVQTSNQQEILQDGLARGQLCSFAFLGCGLAEDAA